MTTALRRHRKERGLRQSDLARFIRTDQTTVSGWERGIAIPQPRHRKRLEQFFGLPLAELLEDENGVPKDAAQTDHGTAKNRSEVVHVR